MKPIAAIIIWVIFTYAVQAQTTDRESIHGMPRKWIMTERDDKGYLVYTPCDGRTPMITIDHQYLTVYWQIDAPTKFPATNIHATAEKNSWIISTTSGIKVFRVVLKDEQQQLYLWTFDDYKWVMTPLANRYKFRNITNPCPTEKKPEQLFLPVAF